MKLTLALIAMAIIAAPVGAQDKMAKDPMKPTMQECKDMMAKEGGAMKGDAMAPKK